MNLKKYKNPFTMDRVDYQSLIIQDLVNLNSKGELNLNPWYQRRSVWLTPTKSYLINTLFERKPIPAIYIRHTIDLNKGASIKEVVDGQQRSRSILEYCGDKYTAKHPAHPKKIKFSDLTPTQKEHFLLTALPVGYLLGSSDADVIDIFARINSVSKNLNGQEKRNAIFSGDFKQFSVNQAVKRTNFWREYNIFSPNDIARMGEILFMSDVVINLLDGVSAYSDKNITKFYKKYNEDFPQIPELDNRLNRVFDTIVSLDPSKIKNTIFTSKTPLFFSLILALDNIKKHNVKKIENGIIEIDSRFNSDVPLQERPQEDREFHYASSATTQSGENRKIRDNYIKKFIA
jgi:Protein of unknown function DUF262